MKLKHAAYAPNEFSKNVQMVQKHKKDTHAHAQHGDFIYFFSLLEKKVGYKQSFDFFYCGGTPCTKQAGGGRKK